MQKVAQTQLDLSMASGAHETIERCQQHDAYDALARSVATNPAALAKLELSQRKWVAVTAASEVERFPHQDEQGFYGSMLPMCEADDGTAMAHARTLELRGEGRCNEDASMAAREKAAAHAAMMTMVDVFTKVKAAYAKEPKFLDSQHKAEAAWFEYGTAQVGFVGETTGGTESACAQRELARVVAARTAQVSAWLKPQSPGGCQGSYGPP